jgi:predicted RNase H-like nuclease (RuvC/YqgF family)
MASNRELKKKIKKLEEENNELRDKYHNATEEIQELKRQLSQYKNSNTLYYNTHILRQ